MFFGKECNYAFDTDFENGFDLYLYNEKLYHANSVDDCVLYAGYYIFCVCDYKPQDWIFRIKDKDGYDKFYLGCVYTNSLLELMWETLIDINLNEDECTEQNWFVFPKGTHKEDIWHWFDERYSRGVYYLLYEYKGE